MVSAKVGLGLRELPPVKGFTGSTVLLWKPGSTYARIVELECVDGATGRLRISQDQDDWSQLRVLQIFTADAPVEPENALNPPGHRAPSEDNREGLSTIPEESENEFSDEQSERVSDYLHHTDLELQRMLDEIPDHPFLIPAPGEAVVQDECDDRLPLTLLSAATDELIQPPPLELNRDSHVELAVYPPETNLLDLTTRPQADEMVLLQMGVNKVRQTVVKRDDDVLTPAELQEHRQEVRQAMLKELQTWNKLKCFSRRPRRGARNIIDVRWVHKFKWEVPTVDVTRGEGRETKTPQPVRTIRARLTVRGFKDAQRSDIDRYAGTSTRCSQKLIVSEAVRNHWPICTADISKAFLQGVTYEQLAEMTGEPMREVNFYLPASDISLLRTLPGCEDFDPQKEVLHCDKPGTGLVDAPRAFSLFS